MIYYIKYLFTHYPQIDVIKPNLSELVSMIDLICQRDGLREGKASVETALRNVKKATSGTTAGEMVNPIDVKTLACALRRVMISGVLLHGIRAQQQQQQMLTGDAMSSARPTMTSEGLPRKIRGKHVIVSMGKAGILWCADKDSVSSSSSSGSGSIGRQASQSFIVVDDTTAVKIFPPAVIPLPKGQSVLTSEQALRLNTNGAGDAFCSGIISALFDESCKELDSTCISTGLEAAANQIARSIS